MAKKHGKPKEQSGPVEKSPEELEHAFQQSMHDNHFCPECNAATLQEVVPDPTAPDPRPFKKCCWCNYQKR